MNLQKVITTHNQSLAYGGKYRLECVRCHKMIKIEELSADLDGEAFVDYYCPRCEEIVMNQNRKELN